MAKKRKRPPPPRKVEKKANPFEKVQNRQKHEVLNRNVKGGSKNVSAARSKAIQKRQQSLLREFESVDKKNSFDDRRLGEKAFKGTTMTSDEKALKRFQVERQKRLSKHDKFNLGDDEEEDQLTHMGTSLSTTLSKMPATRQRGFELDSDDEQEAFEAEKFASEMADAGAFADPDRPKTKKEVMAEVILKSKMHKAERAQEKVEQLELMDSLDEGLDEIRSILEFKTEDDKDAEKAAPSVMDDFMNTARKLGMEARARAADRLKTPEELAKEEKQKLDKLEEARLRRMTQVDGGTMESDEEGGGRGRRKKKQKREKDGASSSGEKKKKQKSMPTDDDLVDHWEIDRSLVADSDSEAGEDIGAFAPKDAASSEDEDDHSSGDSSEDDGDLDLDTNTAIENEDIPFVFDCPKSLKELRQVLSHRTPEQEYIIVERIRKCNHPSLAEGNRMKMQQFYDILLQYFQLLCDSGVGEANTHARLDALTRNMYAMSELLPKVAAQCGRDILSQMRATIQSRLTDKDASHTSQSAFPSTYELFYLRLISALFPTSDFKHNVVVPALSSMCEMLSSVPVRGPRDVVVGLYLCSVVLSYTAESKRLVPEVVAFLLQLLREGFGMVEKPTDAEEQEQANMALVSDRHTIDKITNPLPITFGKFKLPLFADHLLVESAETQTKSRKKAKKNKKEKENKKETSGGAFPSTLRLEWLSLANEGEESVFGTIEFAGSVLSVCLSLIDTLSTTCTMSASYPELFTPFVAVLEAVMGGGVGCVSSVRPTHDNNASSPNLTVHQGIQQQIQSLKDKLSMRIEQVEATRRPLVIKVAPKVIKQYTPQMSESFAPGKDMDPDQHRAEIKSLKKKLKRETKGAMRELRRDTHFIENEKRKVETIEREEREKERKRVKTFLQQEAQDSNVFAKLTKKKRKY